MAKKDSLSDLRELKYQTSPSSLNILGISATNMNSKSPRISTSETALESALDFAKKEFGAKTRIIKLRELDFKTCEGYYSKNGKACTWPCTITQADAGDTMKEIYRSMVLWADVVFVATPIRWGNPSSLYFKMVERLNCVQNQIIVNGKILIKNKVAGFIITGGQDNVQHVAGQLQTFFTQLGFAFPPFNFVGWSRGWEAEDTEHNVEEFNKSPHVKNDIHQLVDNSITLLKQIKSPLRKK